MPKETIVEERSEISFGSGPRTQQRPSRIHVCARGEGGGEEFGGLPLLHPIKLSWTIKPKKSSLPNRHGLCPTVNRQPPAKWIPTGKISPRILRLRFWGGPRKLWRNEIFYLMKGEWNTSMSEWVCAFWDRIWGKVAAKRRWRGWKAYKRGTKTSIEHGRLANGEAWCLHERSPRILSFLSNSSTSLRPSTKNWVESRKHRIFDMRETFSDMCGGVCFFWDGNLGGELIQKKIKEGNARHIHTVVLKHQ